MDELQILLLALGYLVAFMAGRWTAMRSAILNNLAEAVSDGIDKIEDVTGIDIPDDLEDKIEDAVESVKDVIDVAVDDLEDLTVAGLKERLEELGLSTKGRKAELIARIKEHVEGSL